MVAALDEAEQQLTRRPVASMPVDRTLTGKNRQRVAVGLRDRFILREINDLASSGFHSAIIVAAQPVSAVT